MSEAAIERHFRLDENCVPVAGTPRVRVYFAQLRRALEGLRGAAESGVPTTGAERRALVQGLSRLRRTLELLALRHLVQAGGVELKLDTTDSGLFHWSALLELAADLERRPEALAALPEKDELKRRMLDWIVRHSLHPAELQATLVRRVYLEALEAEALFAPFLAGELEKVGAAPDGSSWFWSFACYDRALNRPFLHLLYFEWEGKRLSADSDAFRELCEAAERSALGRASLLVLGRRLD